MLCDRCGERLIEIDRYGERLTGCIECNRWSSDKSAFVVQPTVEDFEALRGIRNEANVKKRRPPKRAPECPAPGYDYIFFSEHALFAASHTPPAFSQSAWVFAVVTSPAKAGPVTATATARATKEIRAFIAFSP